jgi:hypothetical protein
MDNRGHIGLAINYETETTGKSLVQYCVDCLSLV